MMKSCSFSVLPLVLLIIITLASLRSVHGFTPTVASTHQPCSSKTEISKSSLHMGLFDGMKKAFENEKFDAPPEGIKATARHILVKTEDDATMVMDQIAEGSSSFADLAKQYSTCPSSAQGGSLGSFSPGTMVPEFDSVIFDPETQLGEVVGPVPTDFGYHLIVVDKRIGI